MCCFLTLKEYLHIWSIIHVCMGGQEDGEQQESFFIGKIDPFLYSGLSVAGPRVSCQCLVRRPRPGGREE